MSPPLSLPEESQPPVIHDMMTTSPSDHELLGATPFVTNMDLGASPDIPASEFLLEETEEPCSAPPPQEPVAAEQEVHQPGDVDLKPTVAAEQSPVSPVEPVVSIPAETLTAAETSASVEAEPAESSNQHKEEPVMESLIDDSSIKVKESEEEEREEEEKEEEEEAAAERDQVSHDEQAIQEEVGAEEGQDEEVEEMEEEEEEEGM